MSKTLLILNEQEFDSSFSLCNSLIDAFLFSYFFTFSYIICTM